MTDNRITICGGPRTGKTTLAGENARHTDDVMHLGWSEASAEVATWFDAPGPWTIEGVAVVRALRKWLASHSSGRPCDRLIMLRTVHGPTEKGHRAMAKGIETVLAEILDELVARGVFVELNP